MWIQRIFLLLLLLFLTSLHSQKLSEEEPVEGSAHPGDGPIDDEDFEEGSGLPPEETHEHKPTSVKPNFGTEHGVERPTEAQAAATAASTMAVPTRAPVKAHTIPITQKPSDGPVILGLSSTQLLLGILAIIIIIIIIVIIIVVCRKKSSNEGYDRGRQISKNQV